MKLYFGELPCYQHLTEEQKRCSTYIPTQAFNLDKLPTRELQYSFAGYIYDRSLELSFSSLSVERAWFHKFATFLFENYPLMRDITEEDRLVLQKRYKTWLFKNGINLTVKHYNVSNNTTYYVKNCYLLYLDAVYDYFSHSRDRPFSIEDDRWVFANIPLDIRISPVKSCQSISFSDIKQKELKLELKQCIYYELANRKVSTCRKQIGSVRELSAFLANYHPHVQSLKDIDRPILEDFLAYIYTDGKKSANQAEKLRNINVIFGLACRLFEYRDLDALFIEADFEKRYRACYKCYSDAELSRLHDGYKVMNKQIARILLLHELLGLRIADTLTIKMSDIVSGEKPYLHVLQDKTNRSYRIYINEEILTLLSASCNYTIQLYGEQKYVFVNSKHPEQPMKYQTLMYHFGKMITILDLKDDQGNRMPTATHLFRHLYGRRLCDLITDDAVIAQLLGHSDITSVRKYRQMSPKVLTQETKPVVNNREEKIKQFQKGWMMI